MNRDLNLKPEPSGHRDHWHDACADSEAARVRVLLLVPGLGRAGLVALALHTSNGTVLTASSQAAARGPARGGSLRLEPGGPSPPEPGGGRTPVWASTNLARPESGRDSKPGQRGACQCAGRAALNVAGDCVGSPPAGVLDPSQRSESSV